MSVFKLVSEQRVKGKVKKVFDDIKQTRNIKKIPNFWRAIANNPETLERTWNNLKQIMKNITHKKKSNQQSLYLTLDMARVSV